MAEFRISQSASPLLAFFLVSPHHSDVELRTCSRPFVIACLQDAKINEIQIDPFFLVREQHFGSVMVNLHYF